MNDIWNSDTGMNDIRNSDTDLNKGQREISKGIKRSADNMKKDIDNIDQGSSNIQNIDNVVEQLLESAREEPFLSLEFQINDTGPAKTMTRKHKPKAKPKELTEAKPKKLVPIRIVAFCGKLLDIIKYKNLPFQNARDK